MNQVTKFYLASFLKNQIYFVPIMVIFFQDLGLDYSLIFWIFTIGAIFAFVIEIPTGIFADLYGKRQSIIMSKFLIFVSFIAFGFATGFWWLLLANLIYELGQAFRSGTETAFVFDYLDNNKEAPPYKVVKGHQKFYARISEAIATAAGGFLAYYLGFSWVFFIAAIPAFINFVQTLSWEKVEERPRHYSFKNTLLFAKSSLYEVTQNLHLAKIVLNIMIFTSVLFAADKFLQPYMDNLGIEIAYFGIIYSVFLLSVAFIVKNSHKLEDKFGEHRIVNFLTLFSFIPLLILGLGYNSIFGIVLFFFLLMVENIRSPIANTIFHENISSQNRATMGSILALAKSSAKLIILPITGYFADAYSISFALLILSFIVLANGLLFWFKDNSLRS